MVPGSTRWRPSTRMSRTVKGSTAQAGSAATNVDNRAPQAIPRMRLGLFFMNTVSAQQTGNIVEYGKRHEPQQKHHASPLQAIHPQV